jgi:hypothetical protein
MKPACALLLSLLFAGCSTDADPADRRFYNRGWLFPHRDIDLDPSFAAPGEEPGMPPPKMPKGYKPDPLLDY